MNKKVNIYPSRPIITLNPPIRSAVKDVTKPVEDIRACILARAIVEEILPDGTLLNLDLNNYSKDNTTQAEVLDMLEDTAVSALKDSGVPMHLLGVEEEVNDTKTEDKSGDITVEHIIGTLKAEQDKEPEQKEIEITFSTTPAINDPEIDSKAKEMKDHLQDVTTVDEEPKEKQETVQQRPQQYQKNNKKNRR